MAPLQRQKKKKEKTLDPLLDWIPQVGEKARMTEGVLV